MDLCIDRIRSDHECSLKVCSKPPYPFEISDAIREEICIEARLLYETVFGERRSV